MSQPFRRSGSGLRVLLSDEEREIVSSLTDLIEGAGDADGRFDYRVHPNDDEAEGRYRELVGDDLTSLRAADRLLLASTLSEGRIDADTAAAWMRVIGDARLVLAQRLGIEDDGWEERHDPAESPDAALLAYLGHLQDSLTRSLPV